jgi:RNA binding exosome subunit
MVKLEVTVDVIIHATEDLVKFFESFNEMFELKEELFSISNVTGHFENPITILRAKVVKKPARKFLEKFLEILSENQKKEIIQEIEERTENSTLHIRLDKQEFVQGRIAFIEKEAIKVKIYTPIYNKKDTIKVFSEIFQELN